MDNIGLLCGRVRREMVARRRGRHRRHRAGSPRFHADVRLRGCRLDLARFRGNVRRRVHGSTARHRCRRAGSPRLRGGALRRSVRRAGGKRVGLHVYRHLEAVGGVARIESAGQRALGHQSQRICPPLRNRGLATLRARRHLLHRCLHGTQQHRSHLRRQPPAQHHHAVLVHLHAQRPARQAFLLGIRSRVAVRLPPRPDQPLHMGGGGAQGNRQQPRFGGGRGHPGQGAHLGVGQLAAGHGRGNVVEIGQRRGYAQLLARGAEVEAGTPVEPVGAGAEALPAVPAVELPQVAKQFVGSGVDARRQLGDLVAEQFQFRRRGEVPWRPCRVRWLAVSGRIGSGGDRSSVRLHGYRRVGGRHCGGLA